MKFNAVFGSSSIKDTFGWVKLGSKSFAKRPLLHLLTMLSIAIWLLAILAVGGLVEFNYVLVIISTIVFNTILPVAMAAMVVTDQIAVSGQKGNYFKMVWSKLWQSGVLRLILVYVLVVVAISLADSLIITEFPATTVVANGIMQFMQIVLQIVLWIAIPAALRNERIMPFHMLWYSLVAIMKNLIPVVLYAFLNLIILLLIILACFGLMNVVTPPVVAVIFILLMMIFLSWFGVCCAYVSKQVLPLVERL